MFQTFKINSLKEFPNQLEELLSKQTDIVDNITKSSHTTYEDVLKPLQDLDEELSLFFTPLSHLNSVMNSKETQKAYEISIPLLSRFSSQMSQNSELYHKIGQIKNISGERLRVKEEELKAFVLSGVNLDKSKKSRMEEISLELSKLSNNFSQNLLDATNSYKLILDNIADVKELPQSDIDAASFEEDNQTKYKFTLQMPSYLAYMTYGSCRAKREELSKAYSSRAPKNEQIIDELLKFKLEKAQLLGFDNYASYALESRDAPSEDAVIGFLEDLASSALSQAKKELAELQDYAKKVDGIETLYGYDIGYYSEKLKKEKFDFDETMTKPYFEQTRVLNGLLDIVSELFNVTFQEAEVDVWHDCVKVYNILNGKNISGRIYFDLEAREEKRGGAWMNDWETHFIDSKGKNHVASAFVVCNFQPSSDKSPSLLRHDDVVTLFHEMGHAIHHLFGTSKERSVSGINGVAWDVVEFPSQFLENFAYESAIIKRFGFHHETGKPISQTLIDKIKETKNYQAALGILRQVEFSLFDFKLHQKLYQGKEVQELLNSIRETTALLNVPSYNKFQHGFAHIFAGGYSAGYYSYKWAEVLSADAFFRCVDKDSGLNKESAKGYKKYILSKGGSKDMSELYMDWLGEEPKVSSLIKLYEID